MLGKEGDLEAHQNFTVLRVKEYRQIKKSLTDALEDERYLPLACGLIALLPLGITPNTQSHFPIYPRNACNPHRMLEGMPTQQLAKIDLHPISSPL